MEKVLVLRSSDRNNQSHGGFQWGEVGDIITAPDFRPTPYCRNGLHGALWGQGDGSLFNWEEDAIWMLLEVYKDNIIYLQEKVKFPSCKIIAKGERKEITDILVNKGYQCVIGATVTGGTGATVTGGYAATVIGGDKATVTGGDWATVTGGYKATVTGGERATVTGGDGATVTGGDGAVLNLYYYKDRIRIKTAYVGENGIKANTPYRLNAYNEFEEVK